MESTREAITVPAILLMVAAGIGMALGLLVVASTGEQSMQRMVGQLDAMNLPPELRDLMVQSSRDVGPARRLYGIQALVSAFVFLGGLMMKLRRSFGLAVAGAIVACIPCLGPCCGVTSIPLGIWALVALFSSPEVRRSFR